MNNHTAAAAGSIADSRSQSNQYFKPKHYNQDRHLDRQMEPNSNGDANSLTPSWLQKLPVLLRSVGAIAVLLSLYSFLFRGWEGSGDLIRYTMLLGHTALLAIIALASGHFFREGKGPRLLLMLALVSVPVNFAILGAFVFAATTGTDASLYPSYVAWSVESLGTAIMAALVATAILTPITIIAFRTLARGMSNRMAVLYLLSNLALLLPVRDPVLVALLTITLGLYTLFISTKTAQQRTEVKTREGMVALLLQFLPVGILLGRNIWLYAPDELTLTAMSGVTFIALRHCTQLMRSSSWFRTLLEFLSVLVAAVSGLLTFVSLALNFHQEAGALVVGSVVAAAMTYEVAYRANQFNEFYRWLAVLMLVSGTVGNLMLSGGIVAAIATVIVGVATIVLSYLEQKRSLFVGGTLMVIAGLIHQVVYTLQWFDFGYWVALAVTGVVAIVLASVLEAKGKNFKQWLRKHKEQFSEWNY